MVAYIRAKNIKGKTYYYIVESTREKDRIKQRVVRYIGTISTLIKKLDSVDKTFKKQT